MAFHVLPAHRLSLVLVAVLLLPLDAAQAAKLAPGESATVGPGDAPQSWDLTGAALTVIALGQTDFIVAHRNSSVLLQEAMVTSNLTDALSLAQSTATIRGATVLADRGYGLSAIRDPLDNPPGSNINILNSQVTGAGRGINATFGTALQLSGSQVQGTGSGTGGPTAGGVGMTLIGATAELHSSQVSGDNRGAVMAADNIIEGHRPALLLDQASSLMGRQGPALTVVSSGTPALHASVTVQGGSTLSGGNGVLVEAIGNPVLELTISNSALTGNIQGTTTSALHVALNDQASLSGDLHSVSRLSISNGSTLTGRLSGAPDLSLDAGSTFNMTGDSSVGALSLDGATVNLHAATGGFHLLTADSLSGHGTFALGTDLAGHLSDQLSVTGQADGSHTLRVQNTGAEPVSDEHAQPLVHTGSGTAQFSVAGGQVDVGAFVYRLQQRGTDWYLLQAREDDEGGDGGDDDGQLLPSPATRAVTSVFNAAPTLWYGELSTVRSRMGELRRGQSQGGVWARSHASKYRIDKNTALTYRQNQQGLAFGVDTPLSRGNDTWLVGVMGGYSHSSLNLEQGTAGEVDSYYAGLYSTWWSEQGWYVDALLKANYLSNQTEVRMSDGHKTEGDYASFAVGAALEVGRHIDLHDGWFVEPLVQVSGLWVNGQNYSLDNGMRARSNRADSLLGKAGAVAGRTLDLPGGGFVQPYLKLLAAHEFASGNRVTINDSHRFDNDLSGTRGELGAGITLQWREALQVHVDAEYSRGEHIEQPWGVNVGLRYNW